MQIALPLVKQQKENTCGLACLLMALAGYGRDVSEDAIAAEARLERRGTAIDELVRLARHFGLSAERITIKVEHLQDVLAAGSVPIAYIDRRIFDLSPAERKKHRLHFARIHTVIPVHVAERFVTYHDPLGPAVIRRTVRLFRQAFERLGGECVVCSKPAAESRE